MSSTPPTATAGGASLFFADARGCKAWLGGLAVSNVSQSLSSVLDALRVFNRATFAPLERLKCLELLRERVAFMVGEQRAKVFARPLPHGPGDDAAWDVARLVLEEMEAGYRAVLSQPELAPHAALVAQRAIRCLAAQILHHAAMYRRVDPALWSRLHEVYAGAERGGYAEEKVKDSLEAEGGVSSVAEAYARAVLLDAAGLDEMSATQMQFAEALLKLWGRKLKVAAQAPADAPAILPMVVDLSRAEGPASAPRDSLAPSQRVVQVDELARSIRRRIRALQGGEDIATLGLPTAGSGVDPHAVLQKLAKRWCEPAVAETAMQPATGKQAGLVFGLNEAHFFLSGGKAFEQPGKERSLTPQEQNDIAVFGRITERTQSMMVTNAPTFTVDAWDVVGERLGALRLRRRSSGGRGVAVGRIVAVRAGEGAAFQLGMIRALQEGPAGLEAVVALYPGKPEALAVRGASGPWAQAIGLPAIEKLGVAPSIIVPPTMAARGRTLTVRGPDAAHEVKVKEIAEREGDFARITAG